MALVDAFDGIIFDYGGVLVHHQTAEDQAHLARIAGVELELFPELYWSDRLGYDIGAVTGTEYWQHLAMRAGTVFTAETIEELTEFDTVAWMQFDQAMFDWVEQLKSTGKRVAVLSNMPRDLGEALQSRTTRFQLFDFVTLSYEVQAAKPDAAIYEHCLGGLGTAGNRTLFLDDRIENIHGAERLGIHGVQFTSRPEVLPKLSS
ncbi:MAG TPA: HAD family phosphatase [Bryobacteraceae bacterium]|jgi:putative hydrolase of the HAD superfamily|nr:HAD family phosphatase [Bryobacteraceae bacterium]